MKKNDPTYLAALEKAIKEKYGSATIKDFRSLWEEGKEKEYLEQLRSARLQEDKKTKCREEIILGEIKISRRRNIKKDDRTCPVCKTYSFSRRDDLYMNRFDGFRVKFAGPKMIVTYQSEMRVNELHPRNQFENEIEAKFADIIKFLKKQYKTLTKSSVSLTPDSDADINVQTTSYHHTWVSARKQYAIGGFDGVEALRMGSERSAKTRDKSY